MTHARISLHLVLLLLFCCSSWTHAAVLVSIKPIHSLVAGIMQGVEDPQLLLSGGQSPHRYTLKPSDARNIQQADLIIWIGPEMESFLPRILTASERPNIALLDLLKSENKASHNHDHEDHAGRDPHLWLDPLLAKRVVQLIADRLSLLDPKHRGSFEKNALTLQQRLDRLHQELESRLAPVRTTPYIAFHDAYGYLEARYRLNSVGTVILDPERLSGARHIRDLQQKIRHTGVGCIFTEPQFEPRLVESLIEDTATRNAELDPLGSDLPAGPDAYFQLMRRVANQLVQCLANK
ncbi:MAG: zinc ABC transporter substrate-binding protein [endosymbiont of Escarpia spicata]|uniref:High-affinity zinc uptake system protein ZnuA n=1 Tax=endosymbiont of Escarpia spicata TaxID=2200908 RepID=A0A370DQI5_9GAMM|nr:MAG: zinc ABC transporter substrate-binding protein [endosymbiont of Escarpia spicata]